MNLNVVLWLFCLFVAVWCYYRYAKISSAFKDERNAHHMLQLKHIKLQRTLATRGRRLDVLLSTISEVVLRVDRSGRVLGGNEQAAELFQFSQSPKLPQSMVIFYRDGEWQDCYQRAIKILPKQLALPEMKIQGRVFLPRLVALGEKEALLLCMDVTAYMQLQQKQKSLLENLMHDLKTPLTSLLGYARSIEAFADDAELRKEAASIIAQEAKQINDLMNSMLTLNQIEYQEREGVTTCDVVAICENIWGLLKTQIFQKDISLTFETKVETLEVNMAEADCHRVLMNIAENAVKFSPPDSTIHCLIEAIEGKAYISIEDQGHGISEAHLSRVTERFYRVDNVRGREKKEGHGLGLAIVKETLERDGGKLSLRNCESGGLLAMVEVPVAVK